MSFPHMNSNTSRLFVIIWVIVIVILLGYTELQNIKTATVDINQHIRNATFAPSHDLVHQELDKRLEANKKIISSFIIIDNIRLPKKTKALYTELKVELTDPYLYVQNTIVTMIHNKLQDELLWHTMVEYQKYQSVYFNLINETEKSIMNSIQNSYKLLIEAVLVLIFGFLIFINVLLLPKMSVKNRRYCMICKCPLVDRYSLTVYHPTSTKNLARVCEKCFITNLENERTIGEGIK
jgi:hypothetical protein